MNQYVISFFEKMSFGPAKSKILRESSKSRANDYYFTKPNIAHQCIKELIEEIDISGFTIIEPSVGTGNFVKAIKQIELTNKIIGVDITDFGSKVDEFLHMNFLDYTPTDTDTDTDKIAVIGNPPFGKNSSTAIKFINHAAKFSKLIAFILPRTFRKVSVINRLDNKLHLIYEHILENDCFLYEGKSRKVPCVWQIWVRNDFPHNHKWKFNPNELRLKISPGPSASDLVSFGNSNDCTMMIQRVGKNAGKVFFERSEIIKKKNSKNYYFVRINNDICSDLDLLKSFDMIDYPGKFDTSGMPSITKPDVVKTIHKHLNIDTN